MITLDDVELPDQLQWADEFDWSPVKQTITPTVSGALWVEESVSVVGRPITLLSNGGVWWARSRVLALKTMESELAKKMTLHLHDGRQFKVTFRHDPVAVTATEVERRAAPLPEDDYEVNIKLIVIEDTP